MANAKVQHELSKTNAELVDELKMRKKQLKSTQSMLHHCRRLATFDEGKNGSEPDMSLLCQNIEKAVSVCLPGKHAKTKAALVIEAMISGMLFQGECRIILQEMKRLHICAVFKEWKVLKAYDFSSIGAFKTSKVKSLHAVQDEEKQG
jgi:hypothetical protein